MSDDGIYSTVYEDCCMNKMLAFRHSTLLLKLIASQESKEKAYSKDSPSNKHKDIKLIVVVKEENQNYWQKHQDTIYPNQCLVIFKQVRSSHPQCFTSIHSCYDIFINAG
jgi:hypothetical protein